MVNLKEMVQEKKAIFKSKYEENQTRKRIVFCDRNDFTMT